VFQLQEVQAPGPKLQESERRRKEKIGSSNKFKVLASRVMRCGVEVRRQKTEESG